MRTKDYLRFQIQVIAPSSDAAVEEEEEGRSSWLIPNPAIQVPCKLANKLNRPLLVCVIQHADTFSQWSRLKRLKLSSQLVERISWKEVRPQCELGYRRQSMSQSRGESRSFEANAIFKGVYQKAPKLYRFSTANWRLGPAASASTKGSAKGSAKGYRATGRATCKLTPPGLNDFYFQR